MLTSQLPIASWHKQIGDPTIADSILDRLVLKQSTGWFAARWQFGEALLELSEALRKPVHRSEPADKRRLHRR